MLSRVWRLQVARAKSHCRSTARDQSELVFEWWRGISRAWASASALEVIIRADPKLVKDNPGEGRDGGR